ncbi:hypothetical protein RhiirA1_540251 [Rhizophagus irregularis]|uniref:F-box domain-containing protein n=2 Tax=Rhizophagus irregularis TaxID=588596 RepID=U9TAB4_RHIID|nr:hypothetical protein GLOIN_2v1780433 [Rhizophagus irregularis DAOM 181602=DAOM 197198]PKC59821.1 hypothetical protein RhiirA1_540251 [Rhizophagus irregularis]PKY15998.1 hypothetical protein RhiirB3_428293 [Rhizophagus irregularis]POG66593.1 hypothetical protein GLOIN_2v1780433 [Rhizophagus irregularis DAOM 181602=DAOM 197198]UZO25991.1 hypothetical protein OCT59_018242 [Rhizophagus irregularis]CAB4475573.1 unnamed protein product [Rhizophagus irregularis]|eukprot:XP_025173459.1 hypothetical protein GLOIN_2v1780433 [Rhizophagus irregularis DAOM 181602=DAOM 197198]
MSEFPKLVDDCLQNIFEYLSNDLKALHSCVLVNRKWCQISIPVFWRDPWEYRRVGSLKKSFTIINTFILTLPEESQRKLLQIEIIQHSFLKKPIFEYSKFLQSIVLHELENDIKIWIHHQSNQFKQRKRKVIKNFSLIDNNNIKGNEQIQNFKRNKKNLMYELLKFFLIHSQKIDTLYVLDFNFSFIMEIIKREPIAKNCISNLRYLQIGSHMLPIYLSTLSEISNNLDHLEIVNHNLCSEELRNFITVQNNLKELTIEAGIIRSINDPITNNTIIEIFKKKSIIKLTIKDSPSIFIVLKGFDSLTELIIIYNNKYSIKFWEYMANSSLKNLKKLIINSNKIYYDIITQFINNSSCDLEQFIITTTSKVEDPCDIGLYINSISNNCPSLTIFKGVISESNVLELSQLLKKCINLKILHLYPVMQDVEQKMCQFDNLLKEMINISSNNLSRLYLENGWKLTLVDYFKNFMEKRELLRLKPISFHAHKNFAYNSSIFLTICEDYKQKDYLLDYYFYK